MRPIVMFTWLGTLAAAAITLFGGEWRASIGFTIITFVLYTIWEKMS